MSARVLIADDDEVSCQLFAELLEKEGYQVDQAQSGAAALSRLSEQRYDLLIIDVRMPGITGLEVSRTVHKEYPALPVIVMTAFGSMETAIEAIHEGAFDFISKPMNVEELKKTVARALQQRSLQGKARSRWGGQRRVGGSSARLSETVRPWWKCSKPWRGWRRQKVRC